MSSIIFPSRSSRSHRIDKMIPEVIDNGTEFEAERLLLADDSVLKEASARQARSTAEGATDDCELELDDCERDKKNALESLELLADEVAG